MRVNLYFGDLRGLWARNVERRHQTFVLDFQLALQDAPRTHAGESDLLGHRAR